METGVQEKEFTRSQIAPFQRERKVETDFGRCAVWEKT